MSKREFRLADEFPYDRSGPVPWIVTHVLRYPVFPLVAVLASVLNNSAASAIQVLIGQTFDLITTPGWATEALLIAALSVVGAAAGQSLSGIARNWAVEYLAQRVERDAR